MFGYVIANTDALQEEELKRYRACYCGLCRQLGSTHGQASRLTLNYDMTFLVMLLSSLYEPKEERDTKRCPVHPAVRHDYWSTKYTEYAADMNVLLSYLNCIDDWEDDHNLVRLAESRFIEASAKQLAHKYPRQTEAFRSSLEELHGYEKENIRNPDLCAAAFGKMMSEVLVPDDSDYWAGSLRRMGYALGRFIYILDAYCDYGSDRKKGRFNPFDEKYDTSESNMRSILTLLIAECTNEFERLPLVQDVDILRNILYSGVWTKFNLGRTYEGKTT